MSGEARLAAHVEVAGLIRRVQAEGGFAMVLHKGEQDAGTLMVVLRQGREPPRCFERMPSLDGNRTWQDTGPRGDDDREAGESSAVDAYLEKRGRQDPDLWIVELDIADGERFIGLTNTNR